MNQPLVDFAFKQLFGVHGQEELLISFLNAIFHESLPTLQDGTKINVEIHKRL